MADDDNDILDRVKSMIVDSANEFKTQIEEIRRDTQAQLEEAQRTSTQSSEEHKSALKQVLDWINGEEERRKKEEEEARANKVKPTLVKPPSDVTPAQPTPTQEQAQQPAPGPSPTDGTNPKKQRRWAKWV